MKTKIKYLDWNNPTDMLISRDSAGKPVWSEYSRDSNDMLFLRVTVEIAGGLKWFQPFSNQESAELERLEDNRRAAWDNAIQFANLLWRSSTHRQYVVMFRPKGDEREAVCICQLLQGAQSQLGTGIGDEY